MNARHFRTFVWIDPINRRYLIAAVSVSILLFSIFKYFYPFPNLVYDSYYYLRVAILNWPVHAWPVGYSRFVQAYGFFSHSAQLLVWLQYCMLEFSCLLFFFSWLYFFQPGRYIAWIVFFLLFANPLLIACSNFLQSDALFITLSLFWITQLCWLICAPRPYMVITHALILVAAFTVRYNALYYPLIGTIAFIISRQAIRWKVAGVSIPLVLLGWFIYDTGSQIAAVSGKRQFSPFAGWKLANNVIYAYPYAKPVKMESVPEEFWPLDSLIRAYFSKSQPDDPHGLANKDFTYGGYYMFSPLSPLVVYMHQQYAWRDGEKFITSRGWVDVGTLYQKYGEYFVRQYPMAFIQGYLWPNFLRYCIPTPEIFDDEDPWYLHPRYGDSAIEKWFGLQTPTWSRSRIELSRSFFRKFPILFFLSHVTFIVGFLAFFLSKGFREIRNPISCFLALIPILWMVDFGFSVFASPVNLRYEIVMLIAEIAFGLYFIEYTLIRRRPS